MDPTTAPDSMQILISTAAAQLTVSYAMLTVLCLIVASILAFAIVRFIMGAIRA